MLSQAVLASRRIGSRVPSTTPKRSSSKFFLSRITKRSISDHYGTLGVSPTATQSEIKKAFFEKAKKVHPDVNKGDPNAQKKFVDLSAAYEVLKNKDKRAAYDMERQYGGGFGSSSGSSYGQSYGQQQQYQQQSSSYSSQRSPGGGFNPFRNGGGNPYYQQSAGQEDFMKWYRSQFGDAFREFEEFNQGQTTIIEERMPDGSYRVRIIRKGAPHASGQGPYTSYGGAGAGQSARRKPRPEDILNQMFGGGASNSFFGSMFRDGFRQSAQDQEDARGEMESGIPFGNERLDYPSARLTELAGDLSFSFSSGRHIGTMAHRTLSGDQGDVLTCAQGAKVIAKARRYIREGKERILIENGDSNRLAVIEATSKPAIRSTTFLEQLRASTSLHYQIFDERERPSGFLSVSPFRRKIRYYDLQGQQIALQERSDIEQNDLKMPTRDDWHLSIFSPRLTVDSSVFVFSAAFSTLLERRAALPFPGLSTFVQAIKNKLKL